MINGQQYSWEHMQIIRGSLMIGIQKIEYSATKTHENIMGAGDKPVSMGAGSSDFTGSMTILQSEFEAWQASMPQGKNITHTAPTPIVVSYSIDGITRITDRLVGVRFGEAKKGMSTGDTHMTVEIPLIIFDIKYQV